MTLNSGYKMNLYKRYRNRWIVIFQQSALFRLLQEGNFIVGGPPVFHPLVGKQLSSAICQRADDSRTKGQIRDQEDQNSILQQLIVITRADYDGRHDHHRHRRHGKRQSMKKEKGDISEGPYFRTNSILQSGKTSAFLWQSIQWAAKQSQNLLVWPMSAGR